MSALKLKTKIPWRVFYSSQRNYSDLIIPFSFSSRIGYSFNNLGHNITNTTSRNKRHLSNLSLVPCSVQFKLFLKRSYCSMSATKPKTEVEDDVVIKDTPDSDQEDLSSRLVIEEETKETVVLNKTLGDTENREILKSWKWLAEYGPGFPISSHNVKIIHSPSEFYSTLLDKTIAAKERVSLASLYLGNGSQEQKLVEALERNGVENPDLKIKVLLDFTRGSRGVENSRTMLVPLINNCHWCQVFLYHTPALRGLVKRWLPPRWNEIIGLQHMKIYIFDNSVIISGANLSADYFTNRQDRYFLIEDSKDFADFYDNLINRVSDFSLQLDGENTTSLNSEWEVHPSEGDFNSFVSQAKDHVMKFYESCQKENSTRLNTLLSEDQLKKDNHSKSKFLSEEKNSIGDTWIFPLIQMGGIGISNDKDATCRLFESAPKGSHIKLATGYFNLTQEYISRIIQNPNASYDILMAHPKANGFFGAKGFAGGIPAAYTLIAKQFLDSANSSSQLYRLSMKEYRKEKWTYHAKGLWYYPPGETLPIASLIGSPNFGHRSVYRDLETQLYLLTLNKKLREKLDQEQQHLYKRSSPFTNSELSQPNRTVPLWVRMVIVFFRNFF